MYNQSLFYVDVGRIGIGICYDIRFQELAAIYAARGTVCYSYEVTYFKFLNDSSKVLLDMYKVNPVLTESYTPGYLLKVISIRICLDKMLIHLSN